MSDRRRQPATEFEIEVNGRTVPARVGESVAAALWNAGVRSMRSSVAGESRTWLCAMGTCFECLIEIDGQQRRACVTPCSPGLSVSLDPLHDRNDLDD